MSIVFEDKARTHREKAKDANLKYIAFYLRDIVQDWGKQNGSFEGFAKNTDNNKKIWKYNKIFSYKFFIYLYCFFN